MDPVVHVPLRIRMNHQILGHSNPQKDAKKLNINLPTRRLRSWISGHFSKGQNMWRLPPLSPSSPATISLLAMYIYVPIGSSMYQSLVIFLDSTSCRLLVLGGAHWWFVHLKKMMTDFLHLELTKGYPFYGTMLANRHGPSWPRLSEKWIKKGNIFAGNRQVIKCKPSTFRAFRFKCSLQSIQWIYTVGFADRNVMGF